MAYQALARKWRPQVLSTVVGQPLVVQAFTRALETGRIHHAYLLSGTRGVGKTTLARILAKALNCEAGVSATPCGHCEVCRAVDVGRFPDLLEIDAASNTRVEETKSLLENIPYAPAMGRYKVYLMDEVHMLSNHSFNALLKTLEEPPEHVVFILATTEPERLPMTILSRCLQFQLQPIARVDILQQMALILDQEKIAYTVEALEPIALAAKGSMRDALSLLERAIALCPQGLEAALICPWLGTAAFDQALDLLELLAQGNPEALFEKLQAVLKTGSLPMALCDRLLQGLHETALLQRIATYPLSQPSSEERLKKLGLALSAEDLQLFYQIVLMGKQDLPLAPSPELGLEMIFLRLFAFVPVEAEPPISEPRVAVQPKAVRPAVVVSPPSVLPTKGAVLDWDAVVAELPVQGLVRMLAEHSVCESWDGQILGLCLDAAQKPILNEVRQKNLEAALRTHLKTALELKIHTGEVGETTPMKKIQAQKAAEQQHLQARVDQNPDIQALMREMGAKIDSVEGGKKG